MALNKETFKKRTLTAIIFVIVMLAGLLINQWTFFALFFIIHWGCWTEFEKLGGLMNKNYGNASRKTKEAGKLVGCGFLLFCLPHDWEINHFKVFYLGIIVMAASALYFILRLMRENKAAKFDILKYTVFGFDYMSLTWGAMISLRTLNIADVPLGYISALTLVAAIWINDTMQYLVGSLIGKTPFSQISPNKTLEGTLGGSLLCVIVVAAGGYFYRPELLSLFIYIGLVAAIAGTAGDLLESKLKRRAGVKDSGNFMPGHGGFLDRFDSLILAAPFVWVAIEAVMILFEKRTSGF